MIRTEFHSISRVTVRRWVCDQTGCRNWEHQAFTVSDIVEGLAFHPRGWLIAEGGRTLCPSCAITQRLAVALLP